MTQEIFSKLEKELLYEKDNDKSEFSTAIKDYLDNTDFKVTICFSSKIRKYINNSQLQDVPGQEDIVLSKKYGDEK